MTIKFSFFILYLNQEQILKSEKKFMQIIIKYFKREKLSALKIILAIGCVFLMSAHISAATITVTNTNDIGAGSLRNAISSAASGDTIDFNLFGCPCIIALTSSELLIDRKNLFINGPGANQLTISGNNSRRAFRITGSPPASVTISGLTIANGNSNQSGGGIYVELGRLTLSNTIVTNHSSSGAGGGIMVDIGSSLNVLDSTITGNTSSNNNGGGIATASINGIGTNIILVNSTISNNTGRFGGGIYITNLGNLTSYNTNFTNNTAIFFGGGIYNQGSAKIEIGAINLNDVTTTGSEGGGINNVGNLELIRANVSTNTSGGIGGGINNTGILAISDSTISGNTSPTSGGGIYNTNNLTILRSTISGNSTNISGGGIYNAGTLNLTNSTISGNQALVGNSIGGGIHNTDNSTTNLKSCTVAFNCSNFRGGGVYNDTTNTSFNVQNTIIAQNNAPSGGPDGLGDFVSNGFNLIGTNANNTGFTNGTNDDIVGTNGTLINPLLNSLADNGGPTQTHELQSTSPAIDKGNSSFGVISDQRSFIRFINSAAANIPGGNNSDIGAFEFSAPTAAAVGVSGKVLTPQNRGIRNAQVLLIDDNGNFRTITTGTFGYFRFSDVEIGKTYVLIVRSKSYSFAPQIITVKDDMSNLNLTAEK